MPEKVFRPIPLERKHPRKHFDCGDSILNDWLERYSIQAQKKNSSRSYVSLDEHGAIAGFYTLVFGQVKKEDATKNVAKGMPAHPVPVLLIARLAVGKEYQGMGPGKSLLQDALERALSAAEIGGLRAVVVDAKDENAAHFYQHCGFQPSPHNPLRLMATIQELLHVRQHDQ